uniref:Uncharacterized protein n=1 Tax=Branchiostoma floridae TaxID=7739 RepID=C3ZYY0_BRAFL|eukprot:XP_002586240.1 hypothetical protein BRAFLDRAFT_254446 [Branchiostoma floridae]
MAGWSEWSVWSDCTVYCGSVGEQSRVRTCESVLSCKGLDLQTRDCGDIPCAAWREWNPWSPCSITCGDVGRRSRSRSCHGKGGCVGSSREHEMCNMGRCAGISLLNNEKST